MTDIEKQALALVNEIEVEFGRSHLSERIAPGAYVTHKALCRAIEQHEAFKQEVSDAVEKILNCTNANKRYGACLALNRFIIAKPDPLVEEFGHENAEQIRAALAARGLEIREVGHD